MLKILISYTVMDIGTNDTPEVISDDAMRLAAATKRVTLEPISRDVKADALSDTQIAAQRANGGAIANAPIDIEHTSPLAATTTPHPNAQRPHHSFALALTAIVLLIAGGILYIVFQSQ